MISQFGGEGHIPVIENMIIQLQEKNQDNINFQQFSLTLEKHHQPLITPLAFLRKVLATARGLFIADTGHHHIVISTLEGELIHISGTGRLRLTDGAFNEAYFYAPQGVTYDNETQIL